MLMEISNHSETEDDKVTNYSSGRIFNLNRFNRKNSDSLSPRRTM